MLNVELERPLVFFDIESTGVVPRADRIVELAAVRMHPDGTQDDHTWRVNPEIPIPAEASAIHGITDKDVEDCPRFRDIAEQIYAVFENADLAGYNVARFDIPLLIEEFLRCSINYDMQNRRVLDVQRIFHQREPRDLTAALAFYCNELHLDAHGAMPDVIATIRVLEGQFEKYHDLPTGMDEMDAYCNPRDPSWVDRIGRLRWINGEVCLNFGKKKGNLLRDIIETEPSFVKWILRSDFPRDVHRIVADALDGKWPEPPSEG